MGVINAGKGLLLKNAQFNPPRLVSPLMFYAMMKFSTKGFCNDTNCSSVTDGNANESTWFTGKHDRVQDTASMNCVEHHQSISRDRKRGPRSLKSKIAIYQKSMPSIPSLKEFLHQQRVIHQYRHFLRAIANIDDPKWRDQLLCDVRKGFKDLRSSTDSIANQMALKEGEIRLKQLHSIICYDSTKNAAKKKPQEEEQTGMLSSWIYLNDKEDQRGRVGLDWPWNSK